MAFDPNEHAATVDRPKNGARKGKAQTNGQPGQQNSEKDTQAAKPAVETPSADAQQAGTSGESAAASVVIEAPIHSCLPGYATKNIDFDASPRQAAAAKILWSSLSADGARCSGAGGSHPEGRRVESVTMGIRWLLDRLADSIEAETGKVLTEDFCLSF